MNNNINKNVSVWRGNNTPPTDYHVWITNTGQAKIYVGGVWKDLDATWLKDPNFKKENGEIKTLAEINQELKGTNLSEEITKALEAYKGVANGVATLDSNGTVPSSQLPSYVDDVLEYDSQSDFPTTGETGKIYVDTSTNKTYRWSGSTYVVIGSSLALGETSSTAYAGDKGAATTKLLVSLGSVIDDIGDVTVSADTASIEYEKVDVEVDDGIYNIYTSSFATIPAATTTTAGVMTASDKAKLDNLNADTALSTAEKEWIEKQLFDSLFTGSISASPSSGTWSGTNVTVTFTLTTKYDGTLVDLDSVPSGWTKKSTGTYTKTATVTSSTGASVYSGGVTATYKGNNKSINSGSYTNVKNSYIRLSKASSLSDISDLGISGDIQINSGNKISGDKTIDITTAGSYVYFIIANTSTLNNVQQLGLDYLNSKTGVSVSDSKMGTYKVYRSANTMAVGTQTVTIS